MLDTLDCFNYALVSFVAVAILVIIVARPPSTNAIS
jgi:hypothetical protein